MKQRIFHGRHLEAEYLHRIANDARRIVDRLPATAFTTDAGNTADPVPAILAKIDAATVRPRLHWAERTVNTHEAMTTTRDAGRISGIETIVGVPVTGSVDLLAVRPTRRLVGGLPPYVTVQKVNPAMFPRTPTADDPADHQTGVVFITINGRHLDTDAIAAELARIETNIGRMIGFVDDEVTAWRWSLGVTLDRLARERSTHLTEVEATSAALDAPPVPPVVTPAPDPTPESSPTPIPVETVADDAGARPLARVIERNELGDAVVFRIDGEDVHISQLNGNQPWPPAEPSEAPDAELARPIDVGRIRIR